MSIFFDWYAVMAILHYSADRSSTIQGTERRLMTLFAYGSRFERDASLSGAGVWNPLKSRWLSQGPELEVLLRLLERL